MPTYKPDEIKALRSFKVVPADVADAKETVRRFLSRGKFTGRFESLAENKVFAAPTSDELYQTAQLIAKAASADPLAFSIIGSKRSEKDLHRDLIGAFAKVNNSATEPTLSGSERSALEAISLLTGRPAILVENDNFALPSGVWNLLAAYRQSIQTMLKAVGRLEIPATFGMPYAGTGFVVGPGLVMTNRHVLDYLYSPLEWDREDKTVSWNFVSGMTMSIDFKREFGAVSRSEFLITGVATIFGKPDTGDEENDVDLALLRVATKGRDNQPLPEPVRIQTNGNLIKLNSMVCIAGYPAADGERNDIDEMDRIYDGVYQVKRLAPGKITGISTNKKTFTHDCTTLAGNSGSCVYDLETESVIGLHFGGNYLQPNYAVLLPTLFSTPFDTRLTGLNFQGG